MTNYKHLAIISICLLAASTSLAGHRTEREMLSVALRQLMPAQARGNQSIDNTIERLLDTEHYCVYGNKEAGFVVVSRDDDTPALMGYSTTPFDETNLPCGLKWWLETRNNTMVTQTPQYTSTTYQEVEPLVTTLWGQGDPYNFLTPMLNGSHTPTGCVATAMSQVMKFFNYPAQGVGRGYYTIGDNTSHIPMDINNTYAWDQMQDNYSNRKLSDEERLPVAQLMSDAGIATYMNYGTLGSGALDLDATRGFVENFSYDVNAIRCYQREFFSNDEWMSLLYDELRKGKPILYCGVDPAQGGHAFVIDGIDADGLVHVNWGWDGECNGFYKIDDLSPVNAHEINKGHYTEGQSMVFRLRPNGESEDGKLESLWCTPESYTLTGGKKRVSVQLPATYNYHFMAYTGTLFLVLESLDDASAEKQAFAIGQSNTYVTYYGYSADQMILTTKLQAGNYKAYVASKADFDVDYQPIRCLGGAIYYSLTVESDGSNVLSGPLPMNTSTGIVSVSNVATSSSNTLYDLQGRSYSSSDNMPKGIYIIGGKKVVK